jgi:hypothetical protein
MLWAQSAEIRWTPRFKFSASDKRDVVALAKLMGVHDPESVDANLRDDCCRIVAVKGRVVENGPERRWARALMIRNNWREYARESLPKDRLRQGRWIADGSPQVFVGWRVRDGAWFVDVGLGTDRPSIPYRDAELMPRHPSEGSLGSSDSGSAIRALASDDESRFDIGRLASTPLRSLVPSTITKLPSGLLTT